MHFEYFRSGFAARGLLVALLSTMAFGCAPRGVVFPPFEVAVPSNEVAHQYGVDATVRVLPFEGSGPGTTGDVIGEETAGMFNQPIPITSAEPGRVQITRAVRTGLQIAGFNVVDGETADYTLAGTATRFWVDEYATGWAPEYSRAAVEFELALRDRENRIVWAKAVEVNRRSGATFSDTSKANRVTLQQAVDAAVLEVLNDASFVSAFRHERSAQPPVPE